METDIEFLVSASLREDGFKTDVYPINIGSALPLSWFIVVRARPDLMVTVTGGIIKLEGLKHGTDYGCWDLAHPTSLEDLATAIRQRCGSSNYDKDTESPMG